MILRGFKKSTKGWGASYGFVVIKLPPVTGVLRLGGEPWNLTQSRQERTQASGSNPVLPLTNSASYLTFLNFGFLICKMGIMSIPHWSMVRIK